MISLLGGLWRRTAELAKGSIFRKNAIGRITVLPLLLASGYASKNKTHKAASKRFHLLPNGQYSFFPAGRNHNFAKKSAPYRARHRLVRLADPIQTRRLQRLYVLCLDITGHKQMLQVFTTLLLLLSQATGVWTEYNIHAKSFFHDNTAEHQRFLLHQSNLEDEKGVKIQDDLLKDPIFNIADIYKESCSNDISMQRAQKILDLAKHHGRLEFEQRWLGPACLSSDIIKARRERQRWPPSSDMPLLVKDLSLKGLRSDPIHEILGVALKRPDLWFSMHWALQVNWDRIDLKIWRVAFVDFDTRYSKGPPISLIDYLKQVLYRLPSHSRQEDTVEFVLKSIRLLSLVRDIDPNRLGTDLQAIPTALSGFASMRLTYAWSEAMLAAFDNLDVNDPNLNLAAKALFQSHFFELEKWPFTTVTSEGGKDIKIANAITRATATNDIMEIFAFVIEFIREDHLLGEIGRQLGTFLSRINPSMVSPVRVRELVRQLIQRLHLDWIKEHVRKWAMTDDRLFQVLYDLIPVEGRASQALLLTLKLSTRPLKNCLVELSKNGASLACPKRNLVIRELYELWQIKSKIWPGFVDAYGMLKRETRQFFTLSSTEPGTYDPIINPSKYPLENQEGSLIEGWRSVFSDIHFRLAYGFPSVIVLSKCFLGALMHFYEHNQRIEWSSPFFRLTSCRFPSDQDSRDTYQIILQSAYEQFHAWLDHLILSDGHALQQVQYSTR